MLYVLVNFHRMSFDLKIRVPHVTSPSCVTSILFVLSVLSALRSQQLIQQTSYSISLTGRSGLDSWEGAEILLFSTAPSLDLGPTHPPIKGVLKTLSVGIKWPELEIAHSYPSHTMDRKTYSYTSNSANFI
jgi:hypothetical protein